MPSRILRYVAFPVFGLYSALLHLWCVWMAFKLGGILAGVSTLLLPVVAWCYWLGQIPIESIRSAFATSVGTWFVSAALLIAAHVANRKLT